MLEVKSTFKENVFPSLFWNESCPKYLIFTGVIVVLSSFFMNFFSHFIT